MKKLFVVFAALISMASSAQALPMLQLDILGGSYDTTTETIIAPGSSFTLYALFTPKCNTTDSTIAALLTQNYYISAAITPKTETPGANAGSFSFNGAPVKVTGDMVYGIPPLEAIIAKDSGDLARHDVFETYFKEFTFKFAPGNTMSPYNTQDRAINKGAIPPTGGVGQYWMAFNVDTSLLTPGYGIHFDLYSEKTKAGDIDVNQFAPFSHDAQSGGAPVPEPSTILLLGAGLLGFAIYGKRRINNV